MAIIPIFNYLSAGADILGGIAGAVGAEQAGEAKAKGFEENARVAGTTAANTRRSLALSQIQSDYEQNKFLGHQGAAYGAAGVGPGGSPLDVMGDTEAQYKVEAMNRFYQGEEAGKTASDQATFDTEAAAAARKAGHIGIFSAILGGIGNAAKLLIPGGGGAEATADTNWRMPL